jgi:hypothetical protein
MSVSTIIVPHLEHGGQFDTSVARTVGWEFVTGMIPLMQAGGSTTELSATGARGTLAGDMKQISRLGK